MSDEAVTTAELLDAWRDAIRAAELAERLARVAVEAASRADVNATAAEEVAAMAEQVAESAAAVARRARAASDQARRIASGERDAVGEADATHGTARVAETEAHEAYRSQSDQASARHGRSERADPDAGREG